MTRACIAVSFLLAAPVAAQTTGAISGRIVNAQTNRPVGGALIGYIGDRFGRRAALTFSVAAMAIPTFLVGILPGYQTLGMAAPILLTLLRMIQGLSVGGEYTTSIVFMVEHARPDQRGIIGAMACCGAVGGILMGSAMGTSLMPCAAIATRWARGGQRRAGERQPGSC